MSAQRRRRRWAIDVITVSLLAAVVLAPSAHGSPQQAAPAAAPTDFAFYNALADGSGITVGLDIKNLLPLPQLFSLSTVSAESQLSLGISTGLAVLPDPGEVVLSLPGTAAALLGITGIPGYPAAARSDYPLVPSAETDLVPDAGLKAGRLTATSSETSTVASAYLTGFDRPVGLIPFTLGGVRADTETTRTGPTSFTVTAKSTITDLDLLGGLVHIGSVTSEAAVAVKDGVPTPEAPKTTVEGASVVGTAVGITDQGIVAPNASLAVAPLIDAATKSLSQLGVEVHTTPVSTEQTDGHAAAESGQLEVALHTTVDNLPTVVTLGFGSARASLDVTSAPAETTTTPVTTSGGALPSSFGGPATPSAARPPTVAATKQVAAPAAPAAPRAGGAAPKPIATVMDFQPLYRALALAGIALVIARAVALAIARRRPRHGNVRALWRW